MEAYWVGEEGRWTMGGRTWLRGSFFQDFLLLRSRLAYCRSGEGFFGLGGGGVELLSLLVLVIVAVLEALDCFENGGSDSQGINIEVHRCVEKFLLS